MTHIGKKGRLELIRLFGQQFRLSQLLNHPLPVSNIIHTNDNTVDLFTFIKYRSSQHFYNPVILQMKLDLFHLS